MLYVGYPAEDFVLNIKLGCHRKPLDKTSFYFFTARGKDFCKELLSDGRVQILAYTRFKEMIRLSAKAHAIPEAEQVEKIGTIFEVRDPEIEYFNLGVRPIFWEIYTLGNGGIMPKGYEITDACISCGKCAGNCPQGCIVSGKPYQIQ